MNPNLRAELNRELDQHERDIARLRAAYGFSECEAKDFLERYGAESALEAAA